MINARIIDVEDQQLGSVLAQDAAAGDLVIYVVDPSDFDDSGQVSINEGAETPTYSALDPDTGAVTLDTALVNAYLADDGVDVTIYPDSYERYATLVGADDLEDEEGMLARVPLALYDKIPVGLRDLDAGEGETCQAAFFSDELVITDITGQVPNVDGSYIDPTTIPPASTSDGNPPITSPAALVQGTIGGLFVHWSAQANADPVTYEVHLAIVDGFTPSTSTKAAETAATSISLHQMPDGTPLAYFEADGVTPQVYYVRLIAKDVDGSAAAGTEGFGSPVQVTGPDIAARSITGDRIEGNTITAEEITTIFEVAGTFETADAGQRVAIDNSGLSLFAQDDSTLVQFPTDPDKDAQFNGQVNAAALAVSGLAQFANEAQVLPNAEIRLIGGQPDPSLAPSVSAGYPKVFDFNYGVDGNTVTGSRITHYSATGGAAGTTPCYYGTIDTVGGGGTHRVYAVEWLASDGSINRSVRVASGALTTTGPPLPSGFGACLVGSTVVAANISAGTGVLVLQNISLATFAIVSSVSTSLQPGNADLDPTSEDIIGFGSDGTSPYVFSWNQTTGLPNKIQCAMVSGAATGAMTVSAFGTGAVHLEAPGHANNLGDSGDPRNVIGAAWDGTNWYVLYSWYDSAGNLTGRLVQMYDGTTGDVIAGQEVYLPFSVGFFGGGITFDGSDYYLAGGSSTTTNRKLKGSTAVTWDPALGSILYAGYTWSDGAHATGISPLGQVNLDSGIAGAPLQRSTIIVTLPAIPNLASENLLYALFAASTPAGTSLKLQSAPAHASTNTASPVEFLAWDAAGANPSASTYVSGGTPGVLTGDGSEVSSSWELDAAGVLRLPVATAAQRDAVAVTQGDLVFNRDTNQVEVYDGTIHKSVGGELVQQLLSIPATGTGNFSGTLTVSITGLNVGDVVVWVGIDSNNPFVFYTDPICTTAGQITLRYRNTDDVGHALASQTHSFLVFRRS